jgi:peptidoglycan/xylan/chitin deacetylase (PgdA/CDA1 family)
MYHGISCRDEGSVEDYFKLCTPPERFRIQMETLKEQGYTGTDLETGLAPLNDGQVDAGRTVVLTFDDGFRDFHTEAVPVLAGLGFTATMFLPTAFIQDQRRAFKETECLTWSEVRESQRFGMRFGAHTVSHAKLYDLSWRDIEIEVRNSRSDIENHLGAPVTSFAYPYAFPEADTQFCRRLRETLVASGYQSCVTTRVGRVAFGDDPFTLRRLPVNGEDDPALLLAKVTGSYDWIGPAQHAAKRLKGIFTHDSRGSHNERECQA